MKTAYSIDADRVYLTGHSNGCSLAQRVTIEHSEMIAGMACMAMYRLGGFNVPANYKARSVYTIHGTHDGVIPYYNYGPWPHGARQNYQAWADLNQCPRAGDSPVFNGATLTRAEGCSGGSIVQHVKLPGADHFPYKGKGTNVDTTAEAWYFLRQFRISTYSNQHSDGPPPSSPGPPLGIPAKPAGMPECAQFQYHNGDHESSGEWSTQDMLYPLQGLDLPAGEYLEWSCAEYKATYGLGAGGTCDSYKIEVHPNCIAVEGCQSDPNFINTRCPASCGVCCHDAEYPLAHIDPEGGGEHLSWSCAEYKALYELGPGDTCDENKIKAHPACDDNGCQAEPGYINTRCPQSCGICPTPPAEYACSDEEHEELMADKYEFFLQCPLTCTHSDPDAIRLGYPVCDNEDAWEWTADDCRTTACAQYMNSDDFLKRMIPLANKCYEGIGDYLDTDIRSICSGATECKDPEYPLAHLDPTGASTEDYLEWSCTEYKQYYGLGPSDRCTDSHVAAHENCDESCQRDPSYIRTVCPLSCGVCTEEHGDERPPTCHCWEEIMSKCSTAPYVDPLWGVDVNFTVTAMGADECIQRSVSCWIESTAADCQADMATSPFKTDGEMKRLTAAAGLDEDSASGVTSGAAIVAASLVAVAVAAGSTLF